ncbi:MAG TPA: YfhO family protein [Thermoanaerobaculia bacterium]
MAALVYVSTALILLALAHRFVLPLSRLAALILLLLPAVFTGKALLSGGVYGPVDHPYRSAPLHGMRAEYGISEAHNGILTDIYSQMIPWRAAVRWSIGEGQWPLWNPFILSGDVLAAASQPAVYSPFTLLALLMEPARSFTFTGAITLFLAALGTFLLARELGCRELAALLGAAAFALSTAIAFYVLWPLGMSWALFPLVLLATHRCVHQPAVRSGALLLVALTLLMLAGHPETVLHVVLIGIFYALVEMRGLRRRPIVVALVSGIVTLLLCAIYLLPIAEAIPQSGEYLWRSTYYLQQPHAATTVDVVARLAANALPFLHARRWVAPATTELKAESAAVGAIALALALYALWRRRDRPTTIFGAIAFIAMLMQTEWAPVAWLLHKLPLLNITHNERLSFAAALALAMLAALGIEELLRRDDRRVAAIHFAGVFLLLAAGTFIVTKTINVANDPADWGRYKIAAELAGLALASLALALPLRLVGGALLALLVVQRGLSDGGIYRTFPARAAYPPIPLLEPLANVREPFRIVGRGEAFLPATSTLYGLEDVRGYEATTLWNFAKTWQLWCQHQPVWFNRVDDLERPFLSFLNVRYAITADEGATPAGWREVGRQHGARLLENERVLPRAFLPDEVWLGVSDDFALKDMLLQRDFRKRGYIAAGEPHTRPNGPGTVTIGRRKLGYDLTAKMEGDGWIFVSDSAWKGWRAYVDGRRVKISRANIGFLSVYVPRGEHRVRLVYWPESFVTGRAISAATLLALLVTAILRRRAAW